MLNTEKGFSLNESIHHLKHFLPSQAPLKDFIHHNTLHAFQHEPFHRGLYHAARTFGYKVYLQLSEYRQLFNSGKISLHQIQSVMAKNGYSKEWENKLISKPYIDDIKPRIGQLRQQFKTLYKVNFDKNIHPVLFRLLNNFFDQGISINGFPLNRLPFIEGVRKLEDNSYVSMFKTAKGKALLLDSNVSIEALLNRLLGDEALYEQYLFDQQFAHPGWSGITAIIEDQPNTLLDQRNIKLEELIRLELIMEIDVLEQKFNGHWEPLSNALQNPVIPLFNNDEPDELYKVLALWQEAYEWQYFSEVLNGLKQNIKTPKKVIKASTHALFCIDDRECSIRRHLEALEPSINTYGTPGFFNMDFYFQPENTQFTTKVCPAPVSPTHIIKEIGKDNKRSKTNYFSKHSHSLALGWLLSQTLGIWSALKLFFNIFKPAVSPSSTYSFRHMNETAELAIEFQGESANGQQYGFKTEEMASRVEGLLKSIGLIDIETPVVYLVGHGASSSNNTHYAGYDCGACSGRPGSVNARVAAYMANNKAVRALLKSKGINISNETIFIGALHDTTRDEIAFYDTKELNSAQKLFHEHMVDVFKQALDLNAKERSRKFVLTASKGSAKQVHEKVKLRSVSLFEPRPELNHATNTLCIVGGRQLSKDVFLDRRAFLNSYDYTIDHEGNYLTGILKAVAPVCGGINLEYYFSKTDNYRLGAGSKLPHNVMGLIGVANGTDGDLRTGLPLQMIEVHDPMRLMVIVESPKEQLLEIIQKVSQTYEWFKNEWIHLVCFNPDDQTFHLFKGESFEVLQIEDRPIKHQKDLNEWFETTESALPVMLLEGAQS